MYVLEQVLLNLGLIVVACIPLYVALPYVEKAWTFLFWEAAIRVNAFGHRVLAKASAKEKARWAKQGENFRNKDS